MPVFDQALRTFYNPFDSCFGLFACGPYTDGLITLGIALGILAAGLVLFRQLRKPALAARQAARASKDK
jgi:hypothetical protein